MSSQLQELHNGDRVHLTFECRDIGYGVEEGEGEYVYRGIDAGKHTFERTPLEGGEVIYLFEDEFEIDAPGEETPDMNAARMISLWSQREQASSDFERGYLQGRFEEYAAQNAIDSDLFPLFREAVTSRG